MSTPAAPQAPKPAPTAAAPAPNQPAQGQGANASAVAAAQATAPKMMKLKLDGKEVEMSEAEVIGYAQQGKASSQRFQEAAALKKQADETLAFAKANPAEFFKRTGMNARQWAEEYLTNELQIEMMSPEQKKARENEEKLRKFEDEKKQATDRASKEELERLTNQKRQELDVMFTKALNDSGLPRTAYTVKRMAELQLINIKNKYELGPEQLAKLVREDYANEQKSLLSAFDGDQLMDFLGPETVKKLSKAQIAKLKAKGNPISSQANRPARGQDTPGLTWSEYRKRNRKIS